MIPLLSYSALQLYVEHVGDVAGHVAGQHVDQHHGRAHGVVAVTVEPAQQRDENDNANDGEELGGVLKLTGFEFGDVPLPESRRR